MNFTVTPLRIVAVLSFASAITTTQVAASESRTIVDETFADGERTNQNPPSSLEWFTSSSASTLEAQKGALLQNGGGRHIVAHFAKEGAPVTLEVGQKLAFTYSFEVEGATDSAGSFRIGLLNSHDGQVFDDKMNSAMEYQNYRGYLVLTNPSPPKAKQMRIAKRSGSGDRLLSAADNFTVLDGRGGNALKLETGIRYTGELTVQRDSQNQVSISASFTGPNGQTGTFTTNDTSQVETAFDTIVFATGSKSVTALKLLSANLKLSPIK